MYTIYLGIIIGFLFPIIMEINEWRNRNGFDSDCIFMGIFAAIGGGMVAIIIAFALPVTYITTKWSEKLESLQDNNSVNGSFFLGYGQVNGSMKYVYYVQNNDSTYQMWQADYYKSSIKYSPNAPQINITSKNEKDCTWNNFAFDFFDESNQTYIFEVPKGTIKNNFNLDSQ